MIEPVVSPIHSNLEFLDHLDRSRTTSLSNRLLPSFSFRQRIQRRFLGKLVGHSHHRETCTNPTSSAARPTHEDSSINLSVPRPPVSLLPPPFVRALYDYDGDDETALPFREGDVIMVLTELESRWWDGVLNDVRGWFPSNFVTTAALAAEPRSADTSVYGRQSAPIDAVPRLADAESIRNVLSHSPEHREPRVAEGSPRSWMSDDETALTIVSPRQGEIAPQSGMASQLDSTWAWLLPSEDTSEGAGVELVSRSDDRHSITATVGSPVSPSGSPKRQPTLLTRLKSRVLTFYHQQHNLWILKRSNAAAAEAAVNDRIDLG